MSDKWWLRQIEWMAKLFPEKLLKSSIAKQTALTDAGRKNMVDHSLMFETSQNDFGISLKHSLAYA